MAFFDKQKTSIIQRNRLDNLKSGDKPAIEGADFMKKGASLLPHKKKDKTFSVFGQENKIGRQDLREMLKKDSKIRRIEQEYGAHLGSSGREKLEKEVFPQSFGGDISREDFRKGVSDLNKKVDKVAPQEREKIRKQVKFLKKIGGIQ